MSDDSYLIELIEERKIEYKKIVQLAHFAYSNKSYELACVYLSIAANYAWTNFCGFYYSYEIEELIKNISEEKFGFMNKRKKTKKANKILHIATQLYDTGGHTRLIENWIKYDQGRINDLVVTRQLKSTFNPSKLNYFFRNSSNIFWLLEENKKFLDRAKKLRVLSENYDIIIFHIHPDDVVPLLALSNTNSKILFMNHADHCFWIGRDVSQFFLNIRKSGQELAEKKRAINSLNQILLPIPLKPRIKTTKKLAKANLHFKSDKIVILSIASPYKYIPDKDRDIKNILLPLSQKYKNIKIIIVGPSLSEKYWYELYQLSNGTIEAVGKKVTVDEYYMAADIYIDSYPVSSLTSLLDAAKYGIPIFSVIEKEKMKLDDIALNDLEYGFSSFKSLIEKISHFIENDCDRRDYGNFCSETIKKYHLNPYWGEQLNNIYEKISSKKTVINKKKAEFPFDKTDYSLVNMYHKKKSIKYGYYRSFAIFLEFLPFKEKFQYLFQISKKALKNKEFIILLIPKPIKRVLKKIRNAFQKGMNLNE